MTRTITMLATLLATGCFFPEFEREDSPADVTRYAPEILMAEVHCAVSDDGDAWGFEALVIDRDGADDVHHVRLDVVDSIGLVDQIRFDRLEGDAEMWVANLEYGTTSMRCDADYDLIFRARDHSGEETFIQTSHRNDLSR